MFKTAVFSWVSVGWQTVLLGKCSVYKPRRERSLGFSCCSRPGASRHPQAAPCFPSIESFLEWELLEGVQRAPVLLQLPANTRGGKAVTELPSDAAVSQHMSLPGKAPRAWLVLGQNRDPQPMFQQDRQLNFISLLRNTRAPNYSLEAKVTRTRNICPPILSSLRRHCFFRSYRKNTVFPVPVWNPFRLITLKQLLWNKIKSALTTVSKNIIARHCF